MSDGSIERKIALIGPRGMDEFKFSLGDVVLAEWEDKLFYAKIQKIDRVSGKCSLIFDDDSVEECPFSKIHSVTETTAEIVCIICKDGTSLRPNEIVLCDKCGIGYHQNCHDPAIPAEALEFDAPWMCVYCSIGAFCPYLENPFESKPTRKAVRKTRIHTLRSGESFVTSGNSTEDERDSQRESIKAGSLPTHDMSSYYFSSHSHPREGGKPRGRPPFSQKTKPSGDNKRGRGTGRPPARPAIREREQHSERNTEFDAIQQRKLSHDFPRHSGEVARHQARYGSPVRGTRLVEESTEGRKLSPAREAVNKRYLDEPASKVAKVIAHRRDAPREKQRLTQDLARQKRLLSEDIARAELLQREQLTKKFADIFDKSPAGERVEMEDTKISKDNFQAQRCHEENNDVASMYDQCYGPHSPEFTNELTKERGFLSLDKNNDKTRATERESLFDRFLRKGGVQEMKNIEFVNESKVEVKEMRYNVETGASPKCNSSPLSDHVITSCEPDHVTSADVKRKLELEPLTFENVSDDELIFSDNDAQNITRNTHVTEDGLKQNGESPTFPKKFSSAENGIESEPEASCNGVEEECDFVESSTKNDLEYRKGNLFNNLAEYEPCECPSEEGDSNCENNATEGSAPVMYDNTEAAQSIEAGVDEQSDHSSIKSSKLAQLMEEPDMQCEHSSKHGEDCVSQDSEVSASGAAGEVNGANSHECVDKSGTLDPWNDHVYVYEDNNAMVPGEKGTVTKGEKRRRESDREGNSDSQAVEEKAAKKEIQSFGQDEKKTSGNNSQITEQNLENVGNESELSNIEGMSDAGELSEPEPGALLVRGKVKKKKRKKPKSNKTVHKSVVNNPRRKAKGVKGRAGVKNAAKSTKRIKQLDSESDDAMLRSKSNDKQSLADGDPNKLEKKDAAPNSPLHASHNEDNKHDSELNCFLEDAVNGEEDDAKLSPKRSVSEYSFLIEDGVAVQTASDNCDSGQEGCSLSDPQRSLAKENRKRDDAKKEKRLGVRQKRKSEEKEKERERSTPPHLISQNRYARDLPRHNWLVELLLQQKKLCTEDTLQQARAPKDEQSKEEITSGKDDELEPPEEKEEENTASRSEPEPEAEVPASPPKQSSHEEPATPPRDSFQTELHRSFLRRSFPPNVPRTLPRLKPSSPDSSLGSESVLKSNENNAPPPPPLKHALPSKESTGLEPAPKIRKIGDDAESKSDSQEEESVGAESPPRNNESASSEAEHSRKVITPIEILDDDDEKRKHGQDDTPGAPEVSPAGDEFSSAAKSNDSIQKDAGHSPSKSSTLSPPRRLTPLNNTKKPFSAVNPTIPGGIKDSLGRPMHMPPHRAAILIPVVPMHDGNGIAMPPGLGPTSPHMKGYSPRTFTPHLITHSAPVPGSGMFGNAMSPGNRFSANACGHHMHGNMKSGVPCKRDVNCPFHGNNPRGLPSGILSISHHGPMHAFGHHGHDHMSAVMSRERREGEKGLCPQPDCRTCQPDKHSPPGRDHMGDKSPLQGPKVVKPIAHVPNKRPPLMLSHLQQLGKPSPATLRELEALHDDKSRRLAGDLLLSPHQLQKSAEKPPREQVVPAMSPLHHDRRPLHQPLTLSDLNRRREEEMMRAKAEESLKSKTLPGEFIVPGLPSPSRVHSKHPSLPRSNEAVLLSPGRAQTSTSVSPSDKRDPSLLMRRHGDERDREHGSFMSDFLKPGPPRLRPLDESDVRLSSDRQRREEQILVARENSPFLRIHSAKDAAMHHGKQVEEKEGSSPRAVDLLGRVGRPGREVDGQTVRSIASHGNSGIMNIGLRQLDEQRKHGDEARQAGVREEQRVRERVSPELEHRLRLEQAGEHQARRRSLELLQIKEKDPKMELREKEGIRIPLVEREHSDELTLLRPGEGNSASRMAFERSSPIRHKMYPDRPFLAAGMSSRMEARLDPRMVALHELEMHRRGEAIRVSEPSHRELLSRMASSLPMNKGGPHLGKSFFVRPDVSLERRGANSARLASEIRGWSPPTSLASRDYGMMLNSRQAMERLAAAAGKPGTLLGEVIKDVPPHIRQDIERERERERQRLSLEQIEANRRLLHAELKDKVNPLVFSKEHQLRNEQKREQIDVLRAREKLLADRERFLVMERIAEERKRKFNEHESAAHGGMLVRHPSPPQFGRVAEREEYERVKRLKLSDPSVSIPSSIQLGKHLSSITVAASEGKSPKNHTVSSSQIRDKANEQAEARINRPRDVELVKKVTNSSNFERDSMWFRNRELSTRAQEDLDCKRAGLHAVAVPPGFLPPKPGSFLPPREESNSSGKPDEDEVNRCSVCRRNASFLCSGCQAAWYCSSECQLSAWGSHSGECGQKRRQ